MSTALLLLLFLALLLRGLSRALLVLLLALLLGRRRLPGGAGGWDGLRNVGEGQSKTGDVADPEVVVRGEAVRVAEVALHEEPTGVAAVSTAEDPVAGNVHQVVGRGVREPDDQAAAGEVEGRLCREPELVVLQGRITLRIGGRLGVGDDRGEGR